jgi:hypothetical protein
MNQFRPDGRFLHWSSESKVERLIIKSLNKLGTISALPPYRRGIFDAKNAT